MNKLFVVLLAGLVGAIMAAPSQVCEFPAEPNLGPGLIRVWNRKVSPWEQQNFPGRLPLPSWKCLPVFCFCENLMKLYCHQRRAVATEKSVSEFKCWMYVPPLDGIRSECRVWGTKD